MFEGRLLADPVEGLGEVVFTTNHTGYQEVLTDPSFAGQIVVMTAPMIGNYGTRREDAQSRRPWVEGFVVKELSDAAPRGREPLPAYLERHRIPTLLCVDTRAVTRHIREAGAMRAGIFPAYMDEAAGLSRVVAAPPMAGQLLSSVPPALKPKTHEKTWVRGSPEVTETTSP